METEILKLAAGQGLFAVLFVALLFYVLRDGTKREAKYQEIIVKLTDKFDTIDETTKEIEKKIDIFIK